jgi:hypothetical protein
MPAPYLTRIIARYRLLRHQKPDTHIAFTLSQSSLLDAITVSAKAINKRNKIHSHQCRNGRKALNAFANRLRQYKPELEAVETFDDIFSIVAQASGPLISETAIYDTAHRISLYLDIPPDKIYLHAGTRKGADRLLGSVRNKKTLLLTEMPPEFQVPGLTASDLEDILCIYKNEFRRYNWHQQ